MNDSNAGNQRGNVGNQDGNDGNAGDQIGNAGNRDGNERNRGQDPRVGIAMVNKKCGEG